MEFFSSVLLYEALCVVLSTLTVFLFSFFILRILGKRRLSRLTYLDLLLVIILGAASGNAMIYRDDISNLIYSIITITVIGILMKILDEITQRSKRINALLTGDARLIIYNGKILKNAIKKENTTEEDLLALLRGKGFDSPEKVKRAYLEVDGELSVIEKEEKSPSVRK
ncbi:DUF421 domain-containing protein [Patescibacteria group bacterium]|nr:DUF421 domain-containing protein [Patescibacteria group bacterium]